MDGANNSRGKEEERKIKTLMGRLQMLSFHYRREKDRKIERLRFTFTPNGIREFVPREQVYPLIVLNYLLLQLKNK